MAEFDSIRDSPLGLCIGHTLVDITMDDTDEFLADPENKNRIYLHFSNGETIFCTAGIADSGTSGTLGMLGTEDEDDEDGVDTPQ